MEGIEIDEVKLVNGWNALDEFWGTSWVNEHLFEIDELHLDGWRWIMDQVHIG